MGPGGTTGEGSSEVDVPADSVVRVPGVWDDRVVSALAARGRLEVTVESASGEALGHAELGLEDFLEPVP
jgi:hypothetical protein